MRLTIQPWIGDIDNDGAVDILVTNNNGPVRLLHNVRPDTVVVLRQGTGKPR